ncbi:nucleotidyltransferase family protein [Candidatus Gottesmanbacteria bacterium]|nr:nucleotidyltransferase family protein [Candidatus Gottesmanbacteria bacterium]
MTSSVALPHYQEISDTLRRYGVSYAGLFGSRAFGDNKPESDYDILVEFTPDSTTTLLGMMKLQIELEDLLGKPVDIVTKRSISPYFRDDVIRSVIPIYEPKS